MSPYREPEPADVPARRGRRLGPIDAAVGLSHRAWLEPARDRYRASGRTLRDLSEEVILAKSKLSELLRGLGHYPRWEVTQRLAHALSIPSWPMYRLWKQAALDAGKNHEWVARSTKGATALATEDSAPPLEYSALRLTVQDGYRAFAGVFLAGVNHEEAVEYAFARLWLDFNEALLSPDIRRYAWELLRDTVTTRAEMVNGRPVLAEAAFDTLALHKETSSEGKAAQLAESLNLFAAVSQLPDAQRDVIVLRHMCGLSPTDVSDLLGVPLAASKSDELHAVRLLADMIDLDPTEGPTT